MKMKINIVDGQLLDLTGKVVSCMISVLMIFQYFDAKYLRMYRTKVLYWGVKAICCFANLAVYCLDNPLLNLCYWIVMILLAGKFLYYDESERKIKYSMINIAFLLAYSICEAIGGVFVQVGVRIFQVSQDAAIISFVYTIGGSSTAVLLYYLILRRLFISEKPGRISVSQYTIYTVITVYVLINIGEILFFVKFGLSSKDYIFLMVDTAFMLLINLYLFYMLDASAENRELKYKIALYERQAQSNYDYYARQVESNKTALSVTHDLRKHIQVMKELKQHGASSELQDYVEEFEDMISPLLTRQYCDNLILNTIISDKVDYCRKNGIHFQVDIQNVYIDFMKQIDITTLFGNILDNALEACEKTNEKELSLKVYPFNKLVYIQLSNSFHEKIKWSAKGRPLSAKGEHHGIGLGNVENVLKDYNGSIQFTVEEQTFSVEIMISQP